MGASLLSLNFYKKLMVWYGDTLRRRREHLLEKALQKLVYFYACTKREQDRGQLGIFISIYV
jgi:hypothetical protein